MSTRLFKRSREEEPVTEAGSSSGSGAKSPREALNEQWLRIRAGLGGSSAIDSMHAVYRAELRDLRFEERRVRAGDQCHGPEAVAVARQHVEGAGTDRAGAAKDRDAGHRIPKN